MGRELAARVLLGLVAALGIRAVLRMLRRALRAPQIRNIRNTELDMRGNAQLISLSRGSVCYEYRAPPLSKGPLVVLVHGFVGSHAYFQALSDGLVAMGRRVLRYDNYGRGHSSWDGSQQNLGLFVGQLAELLFALGEEEPIDLVGYSQGGAIAAHFSKTFPRRIRSLALLSPVTGDGKGNCRYRPFALLPLHVRVLLLLYRVLPSEIFQPVIDFVKRSVTSENNAAWDDPASEVVSSHLEWVKKRIQSEPALGESIFSTLLYFPLGQGAVRHYGNLSEQKFPIFLGWATRDNVPGTSYHYAPEVFAAIGGYARHVDKSERITTHERAVVPEDAAMVGRQFEWFCGGHNSFIEHGGAVSRRLGTFWKCARPRVLSWRRPCSDDNMNALHEMVEDAYKQGDQFFVDYDFVDPRRGTKYSRTSVDTLWREIFAKNSSEQSMWLFGTDNKKLCACVQIHTASDGPADVAEISFLTVSCDWQRKGIAAEAMALAELTASNMGFRSLQLYVVSTKPWLKRFYLTKCNFVDTGRQIPWPSSHSVFVREAFRADICFHVLHKLIH